MELLIKALLFVQISLLGVQLYFLYKQIRGQYEGSLGYMLAIPNILLMFMIVSLCK